MKINTFIGVILVGLLFTACGATDDAASTKQAEEVARLDSISLTLEHKSSEITNAVVDLDAALDSLELLFPEEE